MTYRLVSAGYATPGQSSRALLDSFSIEMLLAFAYGSIAEKLSPEQRDEFDGSLAKMDEVESHEIVEKELDDGRVIKISQARLDRMRKNLAGVGAMNPRKVGESDQDR